MKTISFTLFFLLSALYMAASPLHPADTTIHYNDRKIIISEDNGELNISVYQQNEQGNTIQEEKIYEGIFTNGRSVERVYENRFEISVPDIFKPKSKRRPSRSHWAGFGIGFSNLPDGLDFDAGLAPIVNLNRSLQYNLNLLEGSCRLGNSNFTGITGMGIQFNSIHWQNNKSIVVEDFKSVVATADPGMEFRRSRLHYTYLTIPLLIETNWNLGRGSHFFVNAGVVAKVKTASSSKTWRNDENGKKQMTKLAGELNIRPITMDLLAQGGINDIGFFVSYSPFTLFRNNRGPVANQATIGLQYYF